MGKRNKVPANPASLLGSYVYRRCNVKRFVFLAICVAISQNTRAAGKWVDLTDFYLWSNTYLLDVIRVEVGGAIQNPGGCSDPDSCMVLTTLSEEAKQRIYSTLLAAKLAGRPVRLRVDGCESDKPTIISVVLRA